MTRSGDIAKALALRRRRGDGRLAVRPRRARRPAAATTGAARRTTPTCRAGPRVRVGTIGTLEQILHGPSTMADGSMNLMGALRRTMATSGYSDLKEFQRVEVVVTPELAAWLPGSVTGRRSVRP